MTRRQLGAVRTQRPEAEGKLANALRALLAVVRLADSAGGVVDAHYQATVAAAQAVLDEFDARKES